ncbi:Glyoxalase/Bleomycin resistance protein/Dihydroxybiphenyl dioxygenase [Sodiomyces alkalinus F11]|uniref:Glyoxalase/Bleomycin resistance protein/Dihydroxybiphenyl dioxygenase n=1 Tax=Sodiomyces alkalinus (strain CBS 110278 / VKM F-3762 / F11) TaxID=1314773 RepID=A0A3N2PRI2_SODAK|nr:Glyoxalase/Bleomycin resistance protein/Dihydroxybiphenyl dioxygenase [Sodiomyces alkalinus F11]ROT37098.1 Glyoxalase/Bleomycin resistance protein/Dihydroxybiphenyl dioxygenase [Sodiomyces alkalinus F11]
MPIDHAGVYVPKPIFQKTLDWYVAALAPIGYKIMAKPTESNIGLGKTVPDWWLGATDSESSTPAHIAFTAEDRATVDAFHKAAVAAGGTDHGGPGLRPEYHPNYYGAFVVDPAGNNIEVVCHLPASS